MKKILSIAVFSLAIGVFSVFSVSAQDTMKKDDGMMKKDDGMMMAKKFDKNLPTVAVIRADWCAYCKEVEPVMMSVMEEYKGKVNFVIFDVTDDSTKAEAMKMANEYGLAKFYKSNKNKTSTVAVLKENKIIFKTSNNTNKSNYTEAIDKALE
jgi:thiol-disulfide isomerase/thioredoxin